jgi:hypothetical protein
MSWMLIAGSAWALLSAPLALLVGRSIRLADQREPTPTCPAVPDFLPGDWATPAAGVR